MTTMYAPPPGPPPGIHASVQYAPPPGPPPATYAPPPGPPPMFYPRDTRDLSQFIRNNLTALATRGWLSVPLPPELESLYADLFAESAHFFNLPSDSPIKLKHAAPPGKSASDEGFADIPGEKQLITLRRLSGIPDSATSEGSAHTLHSATTAAWNATGELFLDTAHTIAESLGLEEDVFDELSADSKGLPASSRASSLLRLFRYKRPPQDTPGGKKIVAEEHKDLGILTLVIGHSPGLDARDPTTGEWHSVEDAPPPGWGKLTATLLCGRTLWYLTRGLYASGDHRVSVRAPSSPDDLYRFSLVFALRPFYTAPIETDVFARSPLIGPFPPARISPTTYPQCSMHGEPARMLFDVIIGKSWNVNVAPEIREMQKKKLADASRKTSDPGSTQVESTTTDKDAQ
ncbi:hypothetical protein FB45DRAFT_899841 [Roridomyces roridus]|uniref:Fe2OG dioxygenase domain-containing protein n=1 Tax=Roridomyces roridus TaxID=1738132 RepID=A0AAD7C7L8_9AGAR|nr:hypothetical protein FB45DRAFT_899841 [Roridomyces roridus]